MRMGHVLVQILKDVYPIINIRSDTKGIDYEVCQLSNKCKSSYLVSDGEE